MNNHTAIWKVIEEWINSQYHDTSFSKMPLSIKNSLDKASCIKIMQEKLFGYDIYNIYDIKYLPEHLKSDTEIAILAIELYSNNIFEISQSLMTCVDFHKLLIQNPKIFYKYEYIFSHSTTSIRGNKEFVNQIISRYPSIYTHLTDELFTDRGILLKVLKKRVFPDRLPLIFSNDKKIVFKLIDVISSNQKKRNFGNGTSYLLTFISKELLINRDILIKLYSSIKYIRMEIPDYFKTDEEVVINAVKSYSSHYKTLNDNLKINPKVAVEAFKGEHELFLKHISQYKFEYSTILEFVKSLVKPTNPKWAREFPNNSDEFEKIADKLVENNMFIDEIALHLVSIWPRDIYFYKYFKILSPELKKDKRIVSLLLHTSVSEKGMTFHRHQEVFKDYVTTQYVFENYIKPYYPDDKEFLLHAMYSAPSLFDGIPEILKSDEEIILSTSRFFLKEKRDQFLESLPDSYSNNKSFILKLLETHFSSDFDDCVFGFSSELLRDDDYFVKEAIKIQPQSIMHSSDRLKNDIEIQKFAFKMFRKVRKSLKIKHEKLRYEFKSPFKEGKTDDVLDLEFLDKHCNKLLNNKKFLLRLNRKKHSNEPDNLDTLPF